MDLLVALLTTRDEQKLKNCIESVLPQTDNIVVVCNTLDFSYAETARTVSESYNLKFILTESNGTPAKGKNSVLEYFRTTDHAYFMQIDADDSLFPDAISKIKKIVCENPDVDVVGLTNNYMLYDGKETTAKEFFEGTDIYKFAKIKGAHGLHLIQLGKFLATNLEYNRMVLYSKKCINSFNFDETFIGSEDVVASYKLYYRNDINYILTDENLYVYNLEDNGNFYSFLSNPVEIKKVLRELRIIVNESRV